MLCLNIIIICATLSNAEPKGKQFTIFEKNDGHLNDVIININDVEKYLAMGQQLSKTMHLRGEQLTRSGVCITNASLARLFYDKKKVDSEVNNQNLLSKEVLRGVQLLQYNICARHNITPHVFMEYLEHHSLTVGGSSCPAEQPRKIKCSKEPYRQIDGACNNLQHPFWGKSKTALTRLLLPSYEDGVYSPRVSKQGKELPNPRLLSSTLFPDLAEDPHHQHEGNHSAEGLNYLSLMAMSFGQFLTHDLSAVPSESSDKKGIQCCFESNEQVLSSELLHHSCMPITMDRNDTFYSKYGVTCLNFVRSMTCFSSDCIMRHAEQINLATSFLDLSMVYGNDASTLNKLREKGGGLLKMEMRHERTCLPSAENKFNKCDIKLPEEHCYMTGDTRSNQTPYLTILHTIFVRYHNYIARKLSKLNPHWSNDKLFEETRKICIGEYQHIVYNEWLPLFIDIAKLEKNNLLTGDRFTNYNKDLHPGVINSFSSAAFRFFHSAIPSYFTVAHQNKPPTRCRLSDYFMKPGISEKFFDKIINGAVTQKMAKNDGSISPEINKYMFKSSHPYGVDLISLDIQRGRDHGISPYNTFRQHFGLRKAAHFEEFAPELSDENIRLLKSVYDHPDDVDLFVGGSLEIKPNMNHLGKTWQQIVVEQFTRTKFGDRFFYTHGNLAHSFTEDQAKEIKKSSLARILCATGDSILKIQKQVFYVPDYTSNSKENCLNVDIIPQLNLAPWKK